MKYVKEVIMKLQHFADPEPGPTVTTKSDLALAFAEAMQGVLETVLDKNTKAFEDLAQKMQDAIDKSVNKSVTVNKYEGIYSGSKTKDTAGNERVEPGIKLARWAKMKIESQKTGEPISSIVDKMYSHDKFFVEEIKQVSITGDGGFLVPEAYAAEIIPLLYANTAVVKLGARRIPMPRGNLNIPKLVEGTDAKYIGENKKKNAKNPKYANVKLSAKKLVSKVVMSNDLLRSSSYEADMFVRDDLVTQLQLKMDFVAMFGAGTEFEPRGIKNTPGVDKQTIAALPSTTNTYDMVTVVETANSNMLKPGWIFNSKLKGLLYNLTDGNGVFIHREELGRGMFQGFPYVVSNQIPTSTATNKPTDVFFGDFSEWLIGDQLALEIKISEDATYADENGNNQSAFDNDQTVMKGQMIHDMTASHGEVFAVHEFRTE